MRFHLPTREAPPIRRPPAPYAPPDDGRRWLRWAVIAMVVFVFGVVMAVATIPDRTTPGPLEGMAVAAQEDLFREIDAATMPGELEWLDLDQQRTLFRTLESTGALTGLGLDRQWAMFRAADMVLWPGVLDGMTLDAQRILFRSLELAASTG